MPDSQPAVLFLQKPPASLASTSGQFHRSSWYLTAALLLLVVWIAGIGPAAKAAERATAGEDAPTEDKAPLDTAVAATEKRLESAVRYLASDELEGRGLGTNGIEQAAQYMAEHFKAAGLKVDSVNGGPFQTFNVTIGSELGPAVQNHVKLVGPKSQPAAGAKEPATEQSEQVRKLQLGVDFMPLAVGGSAKFDVPIVFAGYGITSPDDKYDDYANIDVTDKAVIVMRHEPRQADPHGAFEGTRNSQHAAIVRKVSNAYQHGAKVVLLVTDEVEIQKRVQFASKSWQAVLAELAKTNEEFKAIANPTLPQIEEQRVKIDLLLAKIKAASEQLQAENDPLFAFERGGEASDSRNFPVMHVRRQAIDPMLRAATGKSLSEFEKEIDRDLKPRSVELTGWKIAGETAIKRVEVETKNVIAVLEGEGPHADETVIIGAHYDHLGRGGANAFDRNSQEIHNGADDNGSGCAVLLEIARRMAASKTKPARRVVFIAFTGEERGLLGSAHYVHHPVFPLDGTVAML
ncbi:MAG: M20/M25/M40 family metallo-hydrolase, partial [Planctomycetota bacterium]|nr:M20/M25/M40 family metallo-hydrolase [Planctomycetota bacterium]